jgi:environmental stress-induced protein Ves
MNIDSLLHTPSQVISSLDYRRERWRNGLGWTREILRLPAQGDDWALRLSVAEIEQDAAFSAFPGVERELVLLQGNGVRLRFEDGRVAEVLPPHGRVRFAGEEALHGELVDGTTHDFNLMWKRELLQAELLHRPLVGRCSSSANRALPGRCICWPVRRSLVPIVACRRCRRETPRGWRRANGSGMRSGWWRVAGDTGECGRGMIPGRRWAPSTHGVDLLPVR